MGLYVARVLEEPTARQVAVAFLDGCARASTRPGCPTGCFGVRASLVAGDTVGPAGPARDALAAWRNEGTAPGQPEVAQGVGGRR